MEANGHKRMITVMLMECMGTAMFIWGVISTNLPLSIPFSLFAMVVIFGDITGGHFNPAVTLGVFVSRQNYGENFLFCILIMLSQFVGGFISIGLAWLGSFDQKAGLAALTPTNWAGAPVTGSSESDFTMYVPVMTNEIVGTFLFVSVILMVKGKHTAGARSGVCAAICVVATLLTVISGTNKLGACFNPAVGASVTTYGVLRTDVPEGMSNHYLYHYVWCYMIGPFIGGLCAGLFHILHAKGHEEPCDVSHQNYDQQKDNLLDNEQ